MSRVLCGRCYGNGSTPMGACGVCGGTGNAADRACHNCGAPGRGTFCCGECFVEHCGPSRAPVPDPEWDALLLPDGSTLADLPEPPQHRGRGRGRDTEQTTPNLADAARELADLIERDLAEGTIDIGPDLEVRDRFAIRYTDADGADLMPQLRAELASE